VSIKSREVPLGTLWFAERTHGQNEGPEPLERQRRCVRVRSESPSGHLSSELDNMQSQRTDPSSRYHRYAFTGQEALVRSQYRWPLLLRRLPLRVPASARDGL
jgi:hypothetical protein